MTYPQAKCSALVGWDACNVPFKEHSKISHTFQSRWKNKEHIEFSESFTYCGWRKDYIYELVSPHGNAVRASIRRNRICRSCLKTYLYIESRDRFLAARVVAVDRGKAIA